MSVLSPDHSPDHGAALDSFTKNGDIDDDAEALEALALDGWLWKKLSVRLKGQRHMFLRAFETFDRFFEEDTADMTLAVKNSRYVWMALSNKNSYRCTNVLGTFQDNLNSLGFKLSKEILDCPDCARAAAKFGVWDVGFKLSIQNGSKELALVILRVRPEAYEHMADDLKGDVELALIALSDERWLSLSWSEAGERFHQMSAELQEREDLQKVLIFDLYRGGDSANLQFVPDSSPYKCVKEKALETVLFSNGGYSNFMYLSKELQGDPEVIKASVMRAASFYGDRNHRHHQHLVVLKILNCIDTEAFLEAGELNGALLEEWTADAQREKDAADKREEDYDYGF